MERKKDFFDAIRSGDEQTVLNLLETDKKLLFSKDERGSTPLILATYYNQKEITKTLLAKGAAIDDTDGSGNTALMGVCFKGYGELAEILIEAGASVNHVNAMGATCLIYAATFNKVEIAQLLLENGADVSAKDARGNTALDQAKMQGSQPLIGLLEAKE